MNQELLFTLLYAVAFTAILLSGEYLHKYKKVKTEFTRKFAHSTAALLSLTFPLVYDSIYYVIGIGLLFFLVLLYSKRYHMLSSINDIARKSHGGVLLPIAIMVAFATAHWQNDQRLFIVPILILGVSDSLAGIFGMTIGKNLPRIRIYKKQLNKTYLGTTVFLISAFVSTFFALNCFDGNFSKTTTIAALCVALGTTIAEVFSGKGFDNLTIPIAALLILLFF